MASEFRIGLWWLQLFHWCLVWSAFSNAVAREMKCGSPGFSSTARLTASMTKNYVVGSEVHYQCKENQQLFGTRSRICQPNGTWSGTIPLCDSLGIIRSASQSHSPTSGKSAASAIDNDITTCTTGIWTTDASWTGFLNITSLVTAVWIAFPQGDTVDLEVVVKAEGREEVLCGTLKGNLGFRASQQFIYCPNNTRGEYIHVRDLTKEPHIFQLCEVQVYLRTDKFCLTPDIPDNSHGTKRFTMMTTYLYYCNSGYELFGNNITVCQPDGTWFPQAPTCHKIHCRVSLYLANGRVHCGDEAGLVPLHEEVSYSCDPGFALQGKSIRKCIAWFAWSDEEPTCIADGCGGMALPTVANGAVVANFTNVNSVAFLVCNEGFRPLTDDRMNCLSSGTWSYASFNCVPIQCSSNPVVPHGSIYLLNNSTFYGARLQVICAEGYAAKNGPMSMLRMCEKDGSWEDLTNICTEVICESTPTEDTERGIWQSINESFKLSWGSICVLTCNPGFHVIGAPAVIQCLSNGSWSYSAASCVKTSETQMWSGNLPPSVVLVTAVAVGAGTAVCILCIVASFLVVRKRHQSRTNTTVFHVGMSNRSQFKRTHKSVPGRVEEHYYTTAVYEDIAELRNNLPLPKPRKPSLGLPLLPLDTDPVYAQPFEKGSSSLSIGYKISAGNTIHKENPYTTHIYAEPVDSRRPPSGSSTVSGCTAESWTHTGTIKVNRKMSLPDCQIMANSENSTHTQINDIYKVPYYSSTASLRLPGTDDKGLQESLKAYKWDSSSTPRSTGNISELQYNAIYIKANDQGLYFRPLSTGMKMTDNDIYQDDYFSSA